MSEGGQTDDHLPDEFFRLQKLESNGKQFQEPAGGSSLDVDRLLAELVELVPAKQAAAIAARLTGGRRNALYQRILELRGD